MQISSKNNGDGDRYRVLKEFEFDDYSMSDDRLEGSFSIDDHTLEEGSNGWSADDMFRMNEKKYGVQTSYKENMEGYTVQLKEQDKSSDEYRYRLMQTLVFHWVFWYICALENITALLS